jgi:hypothetical protein
MPSETALLAKPVPMPLAAPVMTATPPFLFPSSFAA